MAFVDCYEHMSVGNVALGTFLTSGTFLSYVPQFGVIIWERSSLGDFAQCNRLLLSYYQIAANGLGMFIVFTLVIAFFKESPTELSHRHSAAIYYSYLWIIFACAFIGVSLAVGYGVENSRTLAFGKALGIVGGICGSLMYIPQIFQTFSNKSVGSLSIVTLLVQWPGSLAVIYYQAFANHLNWSIWVPNVLMAFFQGILLGMCIYYEVKQRCFKKPIPEEDALLQAPVEQSA